MTRPQLTSIKNVRFVAKLMVTVLMLFLSFQDSPSYASTWVPETSFSPANSGGNALWALTSSSDGSHLVAGYQGGKLYISSDSGNTWTGITVTVPTNASWQRMASSADGSHVIASVSNAGNGVGDSGNMIYTSTDGGNHWIARTPTNTYPLWMGVASNYDGTRLFAAPQYGCIYASTDSGVTWSSATSGLGTCSTQLWRGITSDSTGQYVVAGLDNGHIFTSNDYGVTWTSRTPTALAWSNIATSSSGQYLAAATFSGDIWSSQDYGATWVNH